MGFEPRVTSHELAESAVSSWLVAGSSWLSII